MSEMQPEYGWFHRAAQDLEMARRALEAGNPLPAMACYHAQQCAEKYLKGYLVAHALPFRFVHDLVYLTQLCMAREPTFEQLMPAAEILGEYGVATRYPIEGGEDPDADMATEAIRLAEQIAAMVLRS